MTLNMFYCTFLLLWRNRPNLFSFWITCLGVLYCWNLSILYLNIIVVNPLSEIWIVNDLFHLWIFHLWHWYFFKYIHRSFIFNIFKFCGVFWFERKKRKINIITQLSSESRALLNLTQETGTQFRCPTCVAGTQMLGSSPAVLPMLYISR